MANYICAIRIKLIFLLINTVLRTQAAVCDIDDGRRLDCGWHGINQTYCETNNKCCWVPAHSSGGSTPWCFYNQNLSVSLKSIKVCEHHPSGSLTCNPTQQISILNVFYGRDTNDNSCHNSGNTGCFNPKAKRIVENMCKCKSTCSVNPSGSIWDFHRVCDGLNAQLRVFYTCVQKDSIACGSSNYSSTLQSQLSTSAYAPLDSSKLKISDTVTSDILQSSTTESDVSTHVNKPSTQTQLSSSVELATQTQHSSSVELATQTQLSSSVELASQTQLSSSVELATQTQLSSSVELASQTQLSSSVELASQTQLSTSVELATQTQLSSSVELATQTQHSSSVELATQTQLSSSVELATQTELSSSVELATQTQLSSSVDVPSSTKTSPGSPWLSTLAVSSSYPLEESTSRTNIKTLMLTSPSPNSKTYSQALPITTPSSTSRTVATTPSSTSTSQIHSSATQGITPTRISPNSARSLSSSFQQTSHEKSAKTSPLQSTLTRTTMKSQTKGISSHLSVTGVSSAGPVSSIIKPTDVQTNKGKAKLGRTAWILIGVAVGVLLLVVAVVSYTKYKRKRYRQHSILTDELSPVPSMYSRGDMSMEDMPKKSIRDIAVKRIDGSIEGSDNTALEMDQNNFNNDIYGLEWRSDSCKE